MNKVLILTPDSESSLPKAVEAAGFTPVVDSKVIMLVAEAQGESCITVLVDLVSDMDAGLKALDQLQNYPATAHLPHIAVIQGNSDVKLKAVQFGATEIISAPVDANELRIRIRSMMALSFARNQGNTGSDGYAITENRLLGIVDLLEHDLRSPVGIAFSSLDLLNEIMQDIDQIPTAAFQLLDNTLIAMRRQLFLIEDLIDWIRLEANRFEQLQASIDVVNEIREGMKDAQKLADSNGVVIKTELPDNLPSLVGNPILFRRAVNGVLDTALKFTLRGHVITINARSENNGVVVVFSDPGRTVKEQYGDNRLFDIERQSEARNVGSRSSVGMGLPFVRAAIESMGGKVDLDSNEADGLTTLTIWLPR